MTENATGADGSATVRRPDWTADEVATAALGLAAAGVANCAIGISFLFAMATDSCPADCDTSPVNHGMAVTWFGTAAIIVAMIAGIVWSLNKKPAFIWPLLASPAIV
ncbi:hypothetical protein [Prescottella agglutinans]|uniref:Uncharacterized protein n=1 Tax=Prescottella agglutinans TaxID=1644129 RepID=A0ABT6MK27_9NOCA|nr:hypothetical protein [Prescottella agglutinans]MDH6284647.1 hypothetical protein [Prescottella agglutinans]